MCFCKYPVGAVSDSSFALLEHDDTLDKVEDDSTSHECQPTRIYTPCPLRWLPSEGSMQRSCLPTVPWRYMGIPLQHTGPGWRGMPLTSPVLSRMRECKFGDMLALSPETCFMYIATVSASEMLLKSSEPMQSSSQFTVPIISGQEVRKVTAFDTKTKADIPKVFPTSLVCICTCAKRRTRNQPESV